MAQTEQFVSQDARPANARTRKDFYYPGLAIMVALAFAANAWFFYHQGREEALNADSAETPPATIAWTVPVPSSQVDSSSGADASTGETAPATAATDETATPAAGDPARTGKPAAKQIVRAQHANHMLAKTTRPAAPSTTKSIDRGVALLSHPKPAYPLPALREHEQGTVLVLARVDVTGRVSDTRIARRSGSGILDRAAVDEVRRWQFEPALHNGQPIVASVQVPVSYRLQD